MQIDQRNFLGFVLAIQLMSYIAVLFDISFARQIILGVYLLFIPGTILLRIFRLPINKTEAILFSVGLSIALSMFIGLLMNELYPLIGITRPLTTLPLMATLSVVIVTLCLVDFRLNRNISSAVSLALSRKMLVLSALISSFFFLSILGTVRVGIAGVNLLLLVLIIAISALVILFVFLEKSLDPKLFSFALLMISLTLLFNTSLISRYLTGFDIHLEYYLSRLTEHASYWSKTIPEEYNAMLSITILPTIYSNLLNIDLTWVFKIMFPMIFSLVPLGLYQIYQKQMGRMAAFLSAFFFTASSTFYSVEMLSLGRQMIAEVFYVLLLYLLFDQKIGSQKSKMLLMIFGGALVVSHYSLSYIYLFHLIVLWLALNMRKKMRTPILPYILFFFSATFSWYIYVAFSTPFTSLFEVFNRIYLNAATDFFNVGSRGYLVERTLGVVSYSSLLHRMGSVIQNVTQFFILLGFFQTIAKRKEMKFAQEFVSMSVASIIISFASILVPFFATALNVQRLYHITLFLLAPFCIQGASTFFRWTLSAITKVSIKPIHLPVRNIAVLTSMVLITFFLFETGFIYEVTGDFPTSIPLSRNRVNHVQFYRAIISEEEVFSADWLSENSNNSSKVYADEIARRRVLISYGSFLMKDTIALSNSTIIDEEAYVYLRHLNVIEGQIVGMDRIWNTSDISPLLRMENKIYSNGGSDIYFAVVKAHP